MVVVFAGWPGPLAECAVILLAELVVKAAIVAPLVVSDNVWNHHWFVGLLIWLDNNDLWQLLDRRRRAFRVDLDFGEDGEGRL